MIYIKPIAEVSNVAIQSLAFLHTQRVHAITINHIAGDKHVRRQTGHPWQKLADAALTLLVRLYPEVRQASTKELDAACAACAPGQVGDRRVDR